MSKIKIFIGVIGSGKDYQADKLVEQGYIKVEFGWFVRDYVWQMLSWRPLIHQEYELFKITRFHIMDKTIIGRDILVNSGNYIEDNLGNYAIEVYKRKCKAHLGKKNVVTNDCRRLYEVKAGLELLQEGYDVEFIFCNYKSRKYKADASHRSERLAQKLLFDGFEDGQVIPIEYLEKLVKEN